MNPDTKQPKQPEPSDFLPGDDPVAEKYGYDRWPYVSEEFKDG